MADSTYRPKSSNRKAPQKKKQPAKPSAPRQFTSNNVTPLMPKNPHPLSVENRLDVITPEMRKDEFRPWFTFDHVDPAPKYRTRPSGNTEDFMEEGDPEDQLFDHYQPNRAPVFVPGYQRRWEIELDQLPIGTLFQYDTKKVFSFKVSKIVRKKNETLKKRELEFHSEEDLEKPTTYVIHFGYLRVLAGFLQEIQFMEDDKLQSHNCLFRATYLSMILDMFVEELPRIPAKTPWRFRSRVLNPLLQRQLRGIHDDDPTQVEMEVGHGRAAAGKFYLELDPLDPKLANQMLRNILYIWQVRLSLGYLMATTRGEEQSMTSAITNTKDLLESRAKTPDDVWDSHVLMDYEIRLVQRETLEAFYKPLLLLSKKQDRGEEDSEEDTETSDEDS